VGTFLTLALVAFISEGRRPSPGGASAHPNGHPYDAPARGGV